jgi:hypothetical protein
MSAKNWLIALVVFFIAWHVVSGGRMSFSEGMGMGPSCKPTEKMENGKCVPK